MRCDQCIYWTIFVGTQTGHIDDYLGTCKRYPPILDVGFILTRHLISDEIEFLTESDQSFWQQPITTGYQSCGEWSGINS